MQEGHYWHLGKIEFSIDFENLVKHTIQDLFSSLNAK